jgi:hypothetical protein
LEIFARFLKKSKTSLRLLKTSLTYHNHIIFPSSNQESSLFNWIPAFAGMTASGLNYHRLEGEGFRNKVDLTRPIIPSPFDGEG